jgi:NADH dehydrogenase
VGVEPVSGHGLAEGAVLTMAIPLRGHVQVRVEEIHSRAATVVTLQGHPLNGIIRFSVEQMGPDAEGKGALCFEIRSHTRASTMVDFVALSTVGNLLRETTWNTFVGEVVSRSGGEAPEGVQSESRKLPDDESRHIENWAEEVVMRRRRREERERAGAETA